MNQSEFKGIVVSSPSKVLDKSNGGKYVLHVVEITDGVLKGQRVTAQRTILNKDGEDKEYCIEGEEVTIHATIAENEQGKKPFFEIQKNRDVASDEDLLKLLAA